MEKEINEDTDRCHRTGSVFWPGFRDVPILGAGGFGLFKTYYFAADCPCRAEQRNANIKAQINIKSTAALFLKYYPFVNCRRRLPWQRPESPNHKAGTGYYI